MKTVNVDRTVYKRTLFKHVIPAIIAKWPGCPLWHVRMQHDNAPAHVATEDAWAVAAGCRNKRSTITIDAQPPNSPDFNLLDLGMFASLQSLQYDAAPRNFAELVKAVNDAFRK